MTTPFEKENILLRASWDKHEAPYLDMYLVSDVQDPRINIQSILTRALIIDTVWPETFTKQIDDELRFGVVLTWILLQLKQDVNRFELLKGINKGDAKMCPQFVLETYRWLQQEDCETIDYISGALYSLNSDNPDQLLCESAMNTYIDQWHLLLDQRDGTRFTIMEPACGSANDYRFLDESGIAQQLVYCGIDISNLNIQNAITRYPTIDFRALSVLTTEFKDAQFDYLYVHDLFEHLSIEAMIHAIKEVIRVVKYEAWLHFFNLDEIAEHEVREVDQYHWNKLSLDKVCDLITSTGAQVTVLAIDTFLKEKFDCNDYYNTGAYTLLVTKVVK